MASNVTRDHHNLRRNLKLNGKYISNDGDDEGISIADDGKVTIGTLITNLIAPIGTMNIDAPGDVKLDSGNDNIKILTNGDLFGLFNSESVGSTTSLTLYEEGGGGSGSADYLKILVEEHGASTISTVDDAAGADAHLTLDVDGDITLDADGDITLDADGGEIYLKDGGTTFGEFSTDGAYTTLTLYEDGGASSTAYFRIKVGVNGDTGIITEDGSIGTSVADLSIFPDGDLRVAPLFLKEGSAAKADSAAYGQIWVKNETPCELYFTTDAGDDIQLTDGTSAAGGGGSSVLTQVEVIISEAEMNALHTTEKELVAAQGADMVVIPVQIIAFVDRDASTTQSGLGDLRIGFAGGTTLGVDVWYSYRRFMWNESGDRILNISSGQLNEIGNGLANFDNRPLTAKMSLAITSGSIDSVKMFVTYYVYDNS